MGRVKLAFMLVELRIQVPVDVRERLCSFEDGQRVVRGEGGDEVRDIVEHEAQVPNVNVFRTGWRIGV